MAGESVDRSMGSRVRVHIVQHQLGRLIGIVRIDYGGPSWTKMLHCVAYLRKQVQPGVIRCKRVQSGAIRCNKVQSGAVR
jgi:hypothetical protein